MTTAAAEPSRPDEPVEEYVLLHSSTGMVLYRTRATATEISEANKNLAWCAECYRYVVARLLPHEKAAAAGLQSNHQAQPVPGPSASQRGPRLR